VFSSQRSPGPGQREMAALRAFGGVVCFRGLMGFLMVSEILAESERSDRARSRTRVEFRPVA